MIPYKHQIELSKKALDILKEHSLVYLAMEERTGKTLTSILTAEEYLGTGNILVITKKNAIDGWNETLEAYKGKKCSYEVINYHSIHKAQTKPNLIILDEAHSTISGYPKEGAVFRKVRKECWHLPIIYLSATPYAQGTQLLYHQLGISKHSPFIKYKNFYVWFNAYGVPTFKRVKDKNGYIINVNTYNQMRTDEVLEKVNHLFITKTRQDLGFEQEPEDVLHYIELEETTRVAYNTIIKDKALHFKVADKEYEFIADKVPKRNAALHMLEGGVIKVDNEYVILGNNEKIDYIKDTFGDSKDIVIMYYFVAEGVKLMQNFKNATILQATTNAEGIDLSHKKHLIIYSQDWSSARHTQRRARQANKNREEEIKVNFLLVKKGISEAVYDTVSRNKVNFVDSLFKKQEI